jgi:CBS domain-containing protein
MTEQPKCCAPDTNLASAAELMWTNDFRILPVRDEGKLASIITDRDICIALSTRNCRADEISVEDVASREVQSCSPDDDVHTAMAAMRRAKVRRLPVVNEEGKLEGILALNDLVLPANRRNFEIDYDEVMTTAQAISEHQVHKRVGQEKLKFPPIPVAVA